MELFLSSDHRIKTRISCHDIYIISDWYNSLVFCRIWKTCEESILYPRVHEGKFWNRAFRASIRYLEVPWGAASRREEFWVPVPKVALVLCLNWNVKFHVVCRIILSKGEMNNKRFMEQSAYLQAEWTNRDSRNTAFRSSLLISWTQKFKAKPKTIVFSFLNNLQRWWPRKMRYIRWHHNSKEILHMSH